MSSWSEADLELRLCRALDLARKAIHHFAIDGYANPDFPACSFGPEKVVAETAMLIYARVGVALPPEHCEPRRPSRTAPGSPCPL